MDRALISESGKADAFIFMADIWRPEHPSDARYIWLPVQFKGRNSIRGVDGQLDTGFLSVIPVENSLKDGKQCNSLFLTDYCIHLARFTSMVVN